jgi:hypothetical protein
MTRRSSDDDILDAPTKTSRAARDGYVQLSIQLPAFYLRVLDGEARHLSQRRSLILDLLVLRKVGLLGLERSTSAPRYRVDKRELQEVQRYVWHCRPEVKAHLDRLRQRMGNLPPRSWVILALNEWIGLPSGVGDLDEAEPPKKRG